MIFESQMNMDRRSIRRSHGFALVTVLTMLVLLTILALGLLSLATVSLRTTDKQEAKATARANARLSVLIAIGELQKHAGPDKRITTNGTFDSSATSTGTYGKLPEDIANPWLTGIWQREDKPLDPNESGYESHPVATGRTVWIVSGNEGSSAPVTTPTTNIPEPTGKDSPSVWMLRNFLKNAGLSDSDANLLSVKVPLVKTHGGAYGYWVSDESQKAAISPYRHSTEDFDGHSEPPSDIELARLALATDSVSIHRMNGLNALPEQDDSDWKKLFTVGGLELPAGSTSSETRAGIAANFHSLAAISDGVQSDAKIGGLKRDLTVAFESENDDFNKDPFFTREGQKTGDNSDDEGTELTAFSFVNTTGSLTESFSHEMMFYKDSDDGPLHFKAPSGSGGSFLRLPTWHALRDFYRTYKTLTNADSNPSLVAKPAGMEFSSPSSVATSADVYISRGNTGMDADTVNTRFKYPPSTRGGHVLINTTTTGFKPVVARLQIGYSFISGSGTDGNTVPRTSNIKLVADPVVTLWNPYNTAISVTGFSLNTWLPDMMLVIEKQETYKPNRTYSPGDQCVANGMVYEAKTTTSDDPLVNPAAWEEKPNQDGWILAANARVENISKNYGGSNMVINLANGGSFSMEPGELVVFSPNTSTPRDYTGSSGWKFDMERGWNEEGGIAFDRLRVDTTNRTQRGSGNPATSNWDATPFGNDPRSRVWVDADANVRMTIEPYRSWGTAYTSDDPFGFVARYPEGGFRISSGKGGYPSASTKLGDADSLTGDNEGMPYTEELKIPGTNNLASTRNGFGITAHYRARNFIGTHDSIFGREAPNPGMSDVFAVTELSPTHKRWVGSFDWYLRNEADIDAFPVVIGKNNPRFEFNNHGLDSNLHPYGRVSAMPFQLLFRRETSPKNMTNLDASGRGFWGPSNTSSGESFVPMFEIPAAPLASLAQFQHFQASPLDHDPAYIIANSDVSPVIAKNRATDVRRGNTYVDRSWYLNEVLFDSFFLSTLRPLDFNSVIDDSKPLRNARFRFITEGESKESIKSRLSDSSEKAHEKVAANLLMRGSFNVNSTSIQAWKAFLAGAHGIKIAIANPGSGISLEATDGVPVSRTTTPNGGKDDLWRGYRELDDTELTRLSEEIVEQVRRRGPFLSLSDFVNRRLENDDTGEGGALQIAIRDAGLNDSFGEEIDSSTFTRVNSETGNSTNYPLPDQASGPIAQGAAPGFIQQGDLLQTIAPSLTVRGDTFLIRGYGEARSAKSGEVTARAWCEVAVQRTPHYVVHTNDDSSTEADQPWTAPEDLKSEVNRTFGRRFSVISFRWLNDHEI